MYNVHVHCLHAGAQWMSCSYIVTDRIGVLQHLYTSVFTGVYCAVVCTHMDLGMYNVHVHCLHAGAQWMSCSYRVTDRIGVLLCLYVFTGVYCAVVCTHMTVHLFYRCLRGSNISNITF